MQLPTPTRQVKSTSRQTRNSSSPTQILSQELSLMRPTPSSRGNGNIQPTPHPMLASDTFMTKNRTKGKNPRPSFLISHDLGNTKSVSPIATIQDARPLHPSRSFTRTENPSFELINRMSPSMENSLDPWELSNSRKEKTDQSLFQTKEQKENTSSLMPCNSCPNTKEDNPLLCLSNNLM